MGIICAPLTEIVDIPNSTCIEGFGQVQKIAFQSVFDSAGAKNAFTTLAPPTALASWTTFLTATDLTKVQVTPYLQAPTAEAGAARTFGGGNDTVDGIEIILGSEPSSFEAMIHRTEQDIISALKQYMNYPNMGVIMFDEKGDILMQVDSIDTPTEYYPIPISALFVGDKKLGNYAEPDMNQIMFKMKPNWSDTTKVLRPTDFNPLTDLAN